MPFFATSNQGVHFLMSLLTLQISTALFRGVRVDCSHRPGSWEKYLISGNISISSIITSCAQPSFYFDLSRWGLTRVRACLITSNQKPSSRQSAHRIQIVSQSKIFQLDLQNIRENLQNSGSYSYEESLCRQSMSVTNKKLITSHLLSRIHNYKAMALRAILIISNPSRV